LAVFFPPSDAPIPGRVRKRGFNWTAAQITPPGEEAAKAQSQHVQDRIRTRLRAGSSNAEAEHDVSRALTEGKVLTFYQN